MLTASHHLFVYELGTAKIHTHLDKSGGFSSRMALAPDGTTLYTNFDHRIRRWRLPALEEIEPVDEMSYAWKMRIGTERSAAFAAAARAALTRVERNS